MSARVIAKYIDLMNRTEFEIFFDIALHVKPSSKTFVLEPAVIGIS